MFIDFFKGLTDISKSWNLNKKICNNHKLLRFEIQNNQKFQPFQKLQALKTPPAPQRDWTTDTRIDGRTDKKINKKTYGQKFWISILVMCGSTKDIAQHIKPDFSAVDNIAMPYEPSDPWRGF